MIPFCFMHFVEALKMWHKWHIWCHFQRLGCHLRASPWLSSAGGVRRPSCRSPHYFLCDNPQLPAFSCAFSKGSKWRKGRWWQCNWVHEVTLKEYMEDLLRDGNLEPETETTDFIVNKILSQFHYSRVLQVLDSFTPLFGVECDALSTWAFIDERELREISARLHHKCL